MKYVSYVSLYIYKNSSALISRSRQKQTQGMCNLRKRREWDLYSEIFGNWRFFIAPQRPPVNWYLVSGDDSKWQNNDPGHPGCPLT